MIGNGIGDGEEISSNGNVKCFKILNLLGLSVIDYELWIKC